MHVNLGTLGCLCSSARYLNLSLNLISSADFPDLGTAILYWAAFDLFRKFGQHPDLVKGLATAIFLPSFLSVDHDLVRCFMLRFFFPDSIRWAQSSPIFIFIFNTPLRGREYLRFRGSSFRAYTKPLVTTNKLWSPAVFLTESPESLFSTRYQSC